MPLQSLFHVRNPKSLTPPLTPFLIPRAGPPPGAAAADDPVPTGGADRAACGGQAGGGAAAAQLVPGTGEGAGGPVPVCPWRGGFTLFVPSVREGSELLFLFLAHIDE